MPTLGDILADRYRLHHVLGRGGMGHVFAATDQRTGADVAVKVLDVARSERPDARERFEREIGLVAALQHPNTIRVTDCGMTDDDRPYFVMELLRGTSLDRYAKARGPLPEAFVVSILRQVLRSLAQAHASGVIHRDIKPANVFLVDAGHGDYVVKVLDFGIAKGSDDLSLTASNEVPCSPHYVAPERILFARDSPAADVYSVGITAIELLEGKPPYAAPTSMGLLMQHGDLDTPVPLSSVTRQLAIAPVLERAVHKRASWRYATAGEMLAALDEVLGDRAPVGTLDLHRMERNAPATVAAHQAPSLDTTSDAMSAVFRDETALLSTNEAVGVAFPSARTRWGLAGLLAASALALLFLRAAPREALPSPQTPVLDASPIVAPARAPAEGGSAPRHAPAMLEARSVSSAIGASAHEVAERVAAHPAPAPAPVAAAPIRVAPLPTAADLAPTAPAPVAPEPPTAAPPADVPDNGGQDGDAAPRPEWPGLGLTPR